MADKKKAAKATKTPAAAKKAKAKVADLPVAARKSKLKGGATSLKGLSS